jgi:hypothetical protein
VKYFIIAQSAAKEEMFARTQSLLLTSVLGKEQKAPQDNEKRPRL